jgi:hypothetical protein
VAMVSRRRRSAGAPAPCAPDGRPASRASRSACDLVPVPRTTCHRA